MTVTTILPTGPYSVLPGDISPLPCAVDYQVLFRRAGRPSLVAVPTPTELFTLFLNAAGTTTSDVPAADGDGDEHG